MRRRHRGMRHRFGHSRIRSTFGVMPSYKDFVRHIQHDLDDEGKVYLPKGQLYPIEAHSNTETEAALYAAGAEPTGAGSYGRDKWELTPRKLYVTIKRLSENYDDEEAQSLASNIMETLGYEWI